MATATTPQAQPWYDAIEALLAKQAAGSLSELEQLTLNLLIKLLGELV